MSFADDLRNGKYNQNTGISEFELNNWIRAFKSVVTNHAKAAQRSGRNSVKGYFAYNSYDNDTLRIINDERPTEYIGLQKRVPLEYIREMLEIYLNEMGFHRCSVKIIDIQIWKQETAYFQKYKWVPYGKDKTIMVEYHW